MDSIKMTRLNFHTNDYIKSNMVLTFLRDSIECRHVTQSARILSPVAEKAIAIFLHPVT